MERRFRIALGVTAVRVFRFMTRCWNLSLTTLSLARGFLHVVQLLVDLGADVDAQTDSQSGDTRNVFAPTAVLEAAKHGHGCVVLYLLGKGARPGPVNDAEVSSSSLDWSILHLATQLQSESDARGVLAFLLKTEGADLNVKVFVDSVLCFLRSKSS
jgi:hypothetical protein